MILGKLPKYMKLTKNSGSPCPRPPCPRPPVVGGESPSEREGRPRAFLLLAFARLGMRIV